MNRTSQLCVAFTYACYVHCMRNGRLVFQTFYFINYLLMNSFEGTLDICMHTQVSVLVICMQSSFCFLTHFK